MQLRFFHLCAVLRYNRQKERMKDRLHASRQHYYFWKVIYYIDMNGWTEMSEFICNLKKYRLLKELTQEQLAQLVGVRRETIMRL